MIWSLIKVLNEQLAYDKVFYETNKWLIYLYDKADESNKVTVMFNTTIYITLQQPNTEMALIYHQFYKESCLLAAHQNDAIHG